MIPSSPIPLLTLPRVSLRARSGQLGIERVVRSAVFLHGVERKRHLTSCAICHRPIHVHVGTDGMGHFLTMSKHAAIRKSGFIKPIRLKFARTAIRVCRNDCNRSGLSIIKHLQQPPRIGGVVNRFPFVGSFAAHGSNHAAKGFPNGRKAEA